MSRIDDEIAKGTVTIEREYSIGFRACAGCSRETPRPPQSVIDNLTAHGATNSTIWPFEHWTPAGWQKLSEVGWICDRCSRAVMKLLELRKANPGCEIEPSGPPTVFGDLHIIEDNVRAALVLAHEGLLTEFPPVPKMRPGHEYRYGHPRLARVWSNYADYQQGMLRDRIREIRNVLLGKSPEDES